MSPAFPALYPAYSVLHNSIFRSNYALKPRINANFSDLYCRKFGSSASLPSITSAVLNPVGLVCFWGVPAKIANVVVKMISVIVAALQSRWARANKSSQNKSVGPEVFEFGVLPKAYKRASIPFLGVKVLQASFFNRPYIAVIRDTVKSLIAYNWQPTFHTLQYGINTEAL